MVRGKIFLTGGFDGQTFLSSVRIFNPRTETWSRGPDMTVARSGLGCVALGEVDPRSKEWERVANMIHGRSNFRLAVVEGKLFAVGGFDGMSVIVSVECYDTGGDVWT